MNIHEYQAKELLAKYGAPIAAGYPAFSVEEAVEAATAALFKPSQKDYREQMSEDEIGEISRLFKESV